jgi:hypothetical protein
MRGLSVAALAACLLTIAFTGLNNAQAQRQRTVREAQLMPSMREQAVDAGVRFRPTSAAARAATARRLGVTSASPEQMGDTFTVTPRIPFVADRAAMKTWMTSLDSAFDTTGRLQGQTNLDSDVTVRIYNAGNRRFLVECAVSSVTPLTFRMLSVEANSSSSSMADVTPVNGRISFVTHQIWDDALFGVQPTPNLLQLYGWYFTGCEFTALPN